LAALDAMFEERLQEIKSYLDLLDAIEVEAQSGPPRLAGGMLITAQQQKILYSSVYMQLYNLVEATIGRCLDELTHGQFQTGQWKAGDLSEKLRQEWVRVTARTHVSLTPINRLEAAIKLCDQIVQEVPVSGFRVERSGGNWDDDSIEKVLGRIGCTLVLPPEIRIGVKRKIRDDLGAMALIKKIRNLLAHGTLSFVECGENLTSPTLRDLVERTADYLREVVKAIISYMQNMEFLVPSSRPVMAQP
jgi:hypothetical protein